MIERPTRMHFSRPNQGFFKKETFGFIVTSLFLFGAHADPVNPNETPTSPISGQKLLGDSPPAPILSDAEKPLDDRLKNSPPPLDTRPAIEAQLGSQLNQLGAIMQTLPGNEGNQADETLAVTEFVEADPAKALGDHHNGVPQFISLQEKLKASLPRSSEYNLGGRGLKEPAVIRNVNALVHRANERLAYLQKIRTRPFSEYEGVADLFRRRRRLLAQRLKMKGIDQSIVIQKSNEILRELKQITARLDEEEEIFNLSAREAFLKEVKAGKFLRAAYGPYAKAVPEPDVSDEYTREGVEENGASDPSYDRFELVVFGEDNPETGEQALVNVKYAPREINKEAKAKNHSRRYLERVRLRAIIDGAPLDINRNADKKLRRLRDEWSMLETDVLRYLYRINFDTKANAIVANLTENGERLEGVDFYRRPNIKREGLKSYFHRWRVATIEEIDPREPLKVFRKMPQAFLSSTIQGLITFGVFVYSAHHYNHPIASTDFIAAGVTFLYAFTLGTFSDSYDRWVRRPGNFMGEVVRRIILQMPYFAILTGVKFGAAKLLSPWVWGNNLAIGVFDKSGSAISSYIARLRDKLGLNRGRWFGIINRRFTERETISAVPRNLMANTGLVNDNNPASPFPYLGRTLQVGSIVPYLILDHLYSQKLLQDPKFAHRKNEILKEQKKIRIPWRLTEWKAIAKRKHTNWNRYWRHPLKEVAIATRDIVPTAVRAIKDTPTTVINAAQSVGRATQLCSKELVIVGRQKVDAARTKFQPLIDEWNARPQF